MLARKLYAEKIITINRQEELEKISNITLDLHCCY